MIFTALGAVAAAAGPLDVVRVSAYNTSIAVPYTSLPVRQFHPGIAVSTSLAGRRTGRFEWTLDAEVGGYRQAAIETAVTVVPSWRPTVWLHRSVGVGALVGLGYKHAFAAQPTYVMRDGEYTTRASAGRPEARLELGTGVALKTSEHTALWLQYRGSLDGPFSSSLGMPVMMHTALHVGVEVRP